MRPAWEFGIEKDSLEEEKTDGGCSYSFVN